MLDKLLDKFIEECTQLEKEEMNATHAYNMVKQDWEASIEQATQDRRSSKTMTTRRICARCGWTTSP